MHCRAISNLEVFRCEIINAAEQKDGLTSYLMLNVVEAKIFQYDCLEGHNVRQNNQTDRQHREM